MSDGRTGVVWVVSPDELGAAVIRYGDYLVRSILRELERIARDIAAWMQANHPWSNRTGEAEQGLRCEAFESDGGLLLVAYHSAAHGKWLELKWGGIWGVIPLGLETHYGAIMQAARDALR